MIKRFVIVSTVVSIVIFALYLGLFYFNGMNPRIDFERVGQPFVRVAEGFLRTEIIDLTTERIIHSGQTKIAQSHNIRNLPIPITLANDYDSYYVQAGKIFGVGLSRYCYESPQLASGFSMWVKKLDEETLGLGSYKLTEDKKFRILNGEGSLEIDFEKIDAKKCWIISKISFIGDHAFGVKKFGSMEGVNSLDEMKDYWNVTVYDGSWIKW